MLVLLVILDPVRTCGVMLVGVMSVVLVLVMVMLVEGDGGDAGGRG